MSNTLLSRPLAAAVLLAASGSLYAAPTVYLTQASFLAAVSAPATDTYDDLAQAQVMTPLNRSAGAYAYTANASYETGGDDAFYNAGTPGDTWLATDSATDVITFSDFSAGVRGVGGLFFGSDITGAFQAGESVLVTATDGSGSVALMIAGATASSFAGFVTDSAFTSVTVTMVQHAGQGWPTVNDLVLAAAVPEPQSYALLMAGLGVLGWAVRRRRG